MPPQASVGTSATAAIAERAMMLGTKLIGRSIGSTEDGSGMWMTNELKQNPDEQRRLLATYAVFGGNGADGSGHGTHVSSIILNRARYSTTGLYASVAPYADLGVVKAFDADGRGNYADVIQGLQWSDGFVWNDALSSGFAWSDAFMWSDDFMWSDGFAWSDYSAIPAAINVWFDQQ